MSKHEERSCDQAPRRPFPEKHHKLLQESCILTFRQKNGSGARASSQGSGGNEFPLLAQRPCERCMARTSWHSSPHLRGPHHRLLGHAFGGIEPSRSVPAQMESPSCSAQMAPDAPHRQERLRQLLETLSSCRRPHRNSHVADKCTRIHTSASVF